MEKVHTEFLSHQNSFNMIFIQGGKFGMGSNLQRGRWHEGPIHQVHLDDFYMSQFPVTQAIWKEVIKKGKNPSLFQGDNRPVEQVSWHNCQDFVNTLNKQTDLTRPQGHNYRLPTEAEWEYAARGGQLSEGFLYAGSNKLMEVSWYRENSDEETKDVGLLLPNELGLYDMSGNVYEWCWDWYDRGYYETCAKQGMAKNPPGPKSGDDRVLRGGGWLGTSRDCRSTSRLNYLPVGMGHDLGFRLVLSPS